MNHHESLYFFKTEDSLETLTTPLQERNAEKLEDFSPTVTAASLQKPTKVNPYSNFSALFSISRTIYFTMTIKKVIGERQLMIQKAKIKRKV